MGKEKLAPWVSYCENFTRTGSDNRLLQGEENITSAALSADGRLLVVATISNVKVFSIRRRKGDERGLLRVQKLEVSPNLSEDGARVVAFAPDGRWLCIVRPDSVIHMAKVASSGEKARILPQIMQLDRVPRRTRQEKAVHGTLGHYDRTIRCVQFSEDSLVLASGDLSGCIDTWVLEKEAAQGAGEATTSNALSSSLNSDDESEDDDNDDDDAKPAIDGERWRQTAVESPIPRSKSGIVLLSFHPRRPVQPAAHAANGVNGDSAPPHRGHRLMVLTSEHHLVEFEVSDGSLSDWSKRNPKACLPAEFRGVKDRAMGCLWDSFDGRDRLWLYGTSWIWMFDLTRDLPPSSRAPAITAANGLGNDEQALQVGQTNSNAPAASLSKRKRRFPDYDNDNDNDNDTKEEPGAERERKPNSGAGDRIPSSKATVALRSKMRKIVGPDEAKAEWISIEPEHRRDADHDDEHEHEPAVFASETMLARLRRGDPSPPADGPAAAGPGAGADDSPARHWWHTYKYRDILGIVPLGNLSEMTASHANSSSSNSNSLEVAIVERPMWEVELPSRYVKDHE